jgi:ankyrin repeat protein
MSVCHECRTYKDDHLRGNLMNYVAEHNHIDCCKTLIESGSQASLNAPWYDHEYYTDSWNETGEFIVVKRRKSPLHLAILKGHMDMCRLLLENGAVVDHFDICESMKLKQTDLVKSMLNIDRYYEIERVKNSDSHTNQIWSTDELLSHCAALDYPEICQHILDHRSKLIDGTDYALIHRLNIQYAATHSSRCLEILWRNLDEDSSHTMRALDFMCFASIANNYKTCRMLVKYGCDVNKQPNSQPSFVDCPHRFNNLQMGKYPIELTTDLEIMLLLLNNGATLPPSQSRRTGNRKHVNTTFHPLHQAYTSNHTELIVKLFEVQVDVNHVNDDGRTVLYLALLKEDQDMVERLFHNGANAMCKDSHDVTPLHIACSKGNVDLVRYLIYEGASSSINAQDSKGDTPLHIACSVNSSDVVKYLLEQEANVNCTNLDGTAPLHIACSKGNLEIVEYLVDAPKGARINLRTKGPNKRKMGLKRRSPLHFAVISDHVEIAKLLLRGNPKAGRRGIVYRGGAKVDPLDYRNHTPLYYCIEHDAEKCFALLLSDPHQGKSRNSDLYSVMNTLMELHRPNMFNILLAHHPTAVHDLNTQGQTILYHVTNTEYCKILLTNEATLSLTDVHGNTPLHYHIIQGRTAICQVLIQAGASIDTINTKGDSQLHSAVAIGDHQVCELLISKEVNCNLQDKLGYTPLHYILKRKHIRNRKEIVELLKGRTDFELKNSDGESCRQCIEIQ